ncbi:long-chain fatty acid--CoA ligase [Paraconexibacter sp. AEG42_29]
MQDYPLTLVHAFERGERLWGDKRLVTVTKSGRERTTYGEWAKRTRRLAGALDELGVSADGRVGTFAWNSARHLELYFAAPCTGRVLHTLNIRLFPEQVVYVANHAEDEVVFVDRSLLPLFWPLVDELKTVKSVIIMDDCGDGGPDIPDDPRVLDYEELLARSTPVERFHVADENTAAAMCYTSGTTGNPKGVVYSHRSMTLHAMATMLADTFGLRESDVVLPIVPQFHANAWGLAHAAVMTGAELVMPGPDLSAPSVAKLMVEEDITVAAGVPTIWMGVLPELEGKELPSLRVILCGGSAVPKSLSEAYRAQVGMPILQAWGMTETSPIGSVANIKSTMADRPEEELANLRATVGIISPLVDVRIVEPGSADDLPWDGSAQGELQVRGPWIASAYYNDDRADSFTDDGWLRTGDIATIDAEGYIRLVDRTKDVIKSGGEWISSVELENEIMGHPDVAEAAVIGVPDERWGERPLACVVAKPGTSLDGDAIKQYLDGRVAKYWIPERVELIDEVPKTSVGKFSKKDLRERFVGDASGATKAVETA